MDTIAALALVLAQESATAGRPVLPEGARLLLELTDERPDHFGMGFVALGDVDRDGTPDFYVGARCGVTGLCTGQGYGVAVSGRSGKLLYRIESEPDPEGNFFGCNVRRIEDLDGDGIAEIGVNGEYLSTWRGYAQVRSGRDGRLLRHWNDLSIVFDAGDRDGDGRRELVVQGARGSCLADIQDADPERMFLIDKPVSGATGDVDADGVGDYVSLAESPRDPAYVRCGRDGRVLATLWEEGVWGPRWRSSGFAGDVDGDGAVDLYVTRYEHESSTRSWPASDARFQITLVSGRDGRVLRERWEQLESPGDLHPLIALGDVDGDRRDDLLVAQSLRTGEVCARLRIRSGADDSTLAEISARGWSLGVTAALVGDLDKDGVPELALGEHEAAGCAGRAWVISLGNSIRKR